MWSKKTTLGDLIIRSCTSYSIPLFIHLPGCVSDLRVGGTVIRETMVMKVGAGEVITGGAFCEGDAAGAGGPGWVLVPAAGAAGCSRTGMSFVIP